MSADRWGRGAKSVGEQQTRAQKSDSEGLHPPFDAFISYASEDRRTAIQLQRNLERFRVPRKLVGTIGQYGPIVRRLGRVFVDRTDLSAAPALTDVIVAALARSKALIVLCSRAAADPRRWVDREITSYRQVRPDGRIFAVIARDEPPACFPSELLRPNDIADSLDQPLAADLRPQGDGPREAVLKLIAGLLGIDFDLLRRRRAEAERRRRRILFAVAAAYAVTMTAALVAVMSINLRLMESRRTAIAAQAKHANEIDRPDTAMLLAGAALPAPRSALEPDIPLAQAEAVRALLANRLESVRPSSNANLMVVDPNLNRAYLAPFDGRLSAVALPGGRAIRGWTAPNSQATSLAVSADGKQLALATSAGQIIIVDAATGSELSRSESTGGVGRSVAFSRDGRRVAVGDTTGYARVFDVASAKWISRSPAHKGFVSGIAFSFDEDRVLSGSYGGTMIEWNPETGELIKDHGSQGTINTIRGLLQGALWATTFTLGNPIDFQTTAGAPAQWQFTLPSPAFDIEVSSDTLHYVATSWTGKAAYVLDAKSGHVIAKLQHPEWVDAAYFFDHDRRIATIARDGVLRIWRTPKSDLPSRMHRFTAAGSTLVAWGSDKRTLVAAGAGQTIDVIDAGDGSSRRLAAWDCIETPGTGRCWINTLAVSDDNRMVLYGTGKGRIGLLDLNSGRELWRREAPQDWLLGGQFHPDGKSLVVQFADGRFELIGIDDGATRQSFGDRVDAGERKAFPAHGNSFALDTSGNYLATVGLRGLAIIRLSDGRAVWESKDFDRMPIAVAWSSDRRTIAAGTSGDTLRLFTAFGDRQPRIIRGHTGWIYGLSFSPDSRYLISTSNNEQIIWHVASGEAVIRFDTNNPLAGDARFAPDGRHVALSDTSGVIGVREFPFPDGDVRTALCTAMPHGRRAFTADEMIEFSFLDASEREPCVRPPLFSLASAAETISGWIDWARKSVAVWR